MSGLGHMPPRARQVIREVAARHKVTVEDLVSHRKSRVLCRARFEMMAQLRALNLSYGQPSFPRIGDWVDRDHTTVMHGVRRHAELMELADA